MSLVPNKVSLSEQRHGVQQLVESIIAEDQRQIPNPANRKATREAFYHHGYHVDPATGGKLPDGVTVDIYHAPANQREYCNHDVADPNKGGFRSGRLRLAVRRQSIHGSDEELSFYTTSHPLQKRGLRTNEYRSLTPIDPNTNNADSARQALQSKASERGRGSSR